MTNNRIKNESFWSRSMANDLWFIRKTSDTFGLTCRPPQAIINSTITPNMTFTKTSQKFGQWADSRANTVYGLGFSSESNLAKVRTQNWFLLYLSALKNMKLLSSFCSVFLVCREVCWVQRGSAVSQGEVSGEDGAHQHSLSGTEHDHRQTDSGPFGSLFEEVKLTRGPFLVSCVSCCLFTMLI